MSSSIILVDDHPVFRQGLRSLLAKENDLKVVAEASDGQKAIELVREISPDLVIMDINMPNLDGIEATRQILSESTESKVMALSVHSDKQFVREMIQAGAIGYILKESIPEEMIEGIRTVLSGNVYLSKSISNILVSDYKTLVSETEFDFDGLSSTILYTKLHRIPITTHIIPRVRLIDKLENGVESPMTLIAAPAGYGKTILASQWVSVSELLDAWVSLDESDNDLRVFLSYVIEAIQKVFSNHAFRTKSLLGAANLPPSKVIARYLLNDLETLSNRFILVLDDYHHIRKAGVHDLLAELLVHPSPVMHLALVTRHDPPLPLTSLRCRGMLTEISAKDLRFTAAETKSFLERFLHISIADQTAQILEEKMEGWVTGLHLAALSIQSEKDEEPLTARLFETPTFTMDFLMEEVLSHTPLAFQQALLRTSLLERFCAPLCDALLWSEKNPKCKEALPSGREFIDWLTKRNLFVNSLDADKRWFRYHHLFQDFLQRQLRQTFSEKEIAALHSCAAKWFESGGTTTESFQHVLAAGDIGRAAEIVERYRHDEHEAGRWQVVEMWLAKLPTEIKLQRPALILAEAWIAYVRFQLERIPSMVEEAAALLDDKTSDSLLLAELNFFQGNLLYWQGEAESSARHLEAALAQVPSKHIHIVSNIELFLGLARHMIGQKEIAIGELTDRIRVVDASQYFYLTYLFGGLVFIHLLSGELPQALVQAQRAQLASSKINAPNSAAWSRYWQASAHFHGNDLDMAAHHFAEAARQQYILDTRAVLDALAGLVLTQQLRQRPDEAAEAMDRLLAFAKETNDSNCLSVAQSCQARQALLKGELAEPILWAESYQETPAPAMLFCWLEVPVITRVRVLIAIGSPESLEKAIEGLDELQRLTEACQFTCQGVEIAVLQSVALEQLGRTEEAIAVLKEVVTLAGPFGWVRPFVEAGLVMADLLRQLREQNVSVDYIDTLLAAFQGSEPAVVPNVLDSGSPKELSLSSPSPRFFDASSAPQLQVEPLTNRELEILELLAQRLRNQEIADQLYISVETVKTHLNNIYQKLQVGNRREAVEKAKKMGIF